MFTRGQLLQEVWGYDYFGGTRTVDVHVRRLRAKLGTEHEALIGTVRNVGYKFVPAKPEGRRPAQPGASTAASAAAREEILLGGENFAGAGQAAQAGRAGGRTEAGGQAGQGDQPQAAPNRAESSGPGHQGDRPQAAPNRAESSGPGHQGDRPQATGASADGQTDHDGQAGQDRQASRDGGQSQGATSRKPRVKAGD